MGSDFYLYGNHYKFFYMVIIINATADVSEDYNDGGEDEKEDYNEVADGHATQQSWINVAVNSYLQD